MNYIASRAAVDSTLHALSQQLDAAGEGCELVVIGGSALVALGLVDRATRDVDVVAVGSGGSLRPADPLPAPVAAARDRVARDLGLPGDWLNPGPTSLLDFGLPAGFMDRVESARYGAGLTVHFASRVDQIHLKLYALVDQGPGRHEADLRTLRPTSEELLAAALWTRTHDPSPGFKQELGRILRHLGLEDADLGA